MDPYEQAQMQLTKGFEANRKPPAVKKGPGGIRGFLINSLPAIGGGLGAIAGIPGDLFSAGASSVGGAAIGGGLGETLKRKLLHESLDPKQIGIQALEGGATAAFTPLKLGKGITGAAKNFAEGGAKAATKEAAPVAEKSSSFLKNLTTQGQQAQGRVSGVSAGSKVAGRELAPQDTKRILDTLKNEGINTGNANNTLRDITDKLGSYGQTISDHFKTGDAPLHPADTKVIANNFIEGLKTTDPTVLRQANILAEDLQKNVKSTKDLWDFRKTLDKRIPDSKFMDENTSAKVTALKEMRSYISDELGHIPAMKSYHDLSEIKPFVSAEAKRLNNPGGGIIGRVLSSGPVQKVENGVGKVTEKVGNIGSETPATPIVEASTTPGAGILRKLTSTVSPKEIARSVAAPIGSPGKAAGSILKQEAGRGFGVPASLSNAQQTSQQQTPEQLQEADNLINTPVASPGQSDASDLFNTENIQKMVLADIASTGGKNISTILSLQKAFAPASTSLNATQQQQANNANSGLSDIQNISDMLQEDPNIATKDAIPGGSIAHRLTGTTDYEAAKSNIIDVISRLRSGAAISTGEEKLYKSLLPGPADSAESAQAKLNRLSELLGSFSNPQPSSGSDISDLMANSGEE